MRSFIVVAFLIICVATVTMAESPAKLVGSVEAVYHEGVVTFQVSHHEAVSSSVKVYDLESDALIYDSGPREATLVTWPAGHDANGSYRYVVTAWNADGQVVVSQTAANKVLTPIAAISFDTVPADTKFLGPNEIIMGNDLQVGDPQRARLGDNFSQGGDFNLYEEDGSTGHFWIQPDVNGEGAFVYVGGSSASGSQFVLQGMGVGGEADFAQTGTSDFYFRSGNTGDTSAVLPTGSISSIEMGNEPGVAQMSADSSVDISSGSTTNILARTFTAPTSGYVVAMATIDVYLNATGLSYMYCGLDTAVGTIPAGEDFGVNIPSVAADGRYGFNISPVRIFPVAAGTETIYGSCYAAGGTHEVWDRRLSLVFIPTAYGTVTESAPGGGDGDMEQTEGYVGSNTGMTQAEIEAEQAESIAINLARIQAELDAIKAITDAYEAELTNDQ